jgi:hypothetical protein
MPIGALLGTNAFDSETTRLLGAAFEAAWRKLEASGSALAGNSRAAETRDLLARRIIEVGRRGETNCDRLVEDALAHLARLHGDSHVAIDRKSKPPVQLTQSPGA